MKENITIVRQALLGLVTIAIVAVGTSAGVFTATEAGAVAAVYAWFITTFVYKTMTLKKTLKCFLNALPTLGTIMAIIATSSAFSYSYLSYLKVPSRVAEMFLSVSSSPAVIMLLMLLLMVF